MSKENKNYCYFKKEENNLKKEYDNEYLVIYNKSVIFHNIDINKVIEFARHLKAGKYIIQKCELDESSNIQKFYTRVTF